MDGQEASLQPTADPFDFLATFGVDSAAAPETLSPPLPADAGQQTGADVEEPGKGADLEGQTAKAAGGEGEPARQPEADAKAGQEPAAAAVGEQAEEGRQGEERKSASFWSQFLNTSKPIEEVRAHIEQRSPSRYGELESAVIAKYARDPAAFARRYFEADRVGYGKLAVEIVTNDPTGYFVRHLTGRDGLTGEQVRAAVEFYERNKDRVADSGGADDLSAEELEDLQSLLPEETVEKIKRQAAAARSSAQGKPAQAGDEGAQVKPGEGKADAPPAADPLADPQAAETWAAARDSIESYLTEKVTGQYKLAPTEAERKLAPDVADLKDVAVTLFFEGSKRLGIPPWDAGFEQWARGRPDADESIVNMYQFSTRKERENALEAARALRGPTDKYSDERLKHPVFARLSRLIAQAAKGANPPAVNETDIPGSPASPSQRTPRTGLGALDDLLIADAAQRAG